MFTVSKTLSWLEWNNSLLSGMKADPESDLCIRLGGVHHEHMIQWQKYHCMGVASYQPWVHPAWRPMNRCLQTVHQLGTQYDSSSENTDRVDRRGSRWRSSEALFTRQSWNLTQSSVECPEHWTSHIITSLVIWKQIFIMSTHSFYLTNIYKQDKPWIDLAADIQQNLANLETISCNLF